MKYFIRAIKQFVYLTVILTLIILIMVKAGFVDADPSQIFVNGYDSFWQIGLIIAVFAGIYPRIGYSTREAKAYGSDEEVIKGLREVMEDHGYKLASEIDSEMKFIKRAPFSRMAKLWEDTITVSRTLGGFSMEGITKDVVRVVSAVEFKFSLPGEDA